MATKNLFIILGLSLIASLNCQTCSPNMRISETICFNNLKIFELENKYYRAGHFASNIKGDMILEYSFQQYRLFYGLKKDGKLYYPEETKEIELINGNIETERLARYESINSFVSLANDINKEKEYLMSFSSWKTVVEIYDLENENYNTLETVNFFNHEQGTYSYVFQLLEANYQEMKIYFCIYTTLQLNPQEIYTENVIQIKRFGLSNINFNLVQEKTIDITYNEITRITSSIIFENFQILALIYWPNDETYYSLRLYNYELELKYDVQISETITRDSIGDGMFFKVCNLYDQYAAFLYFMNSHEFRFEILVINKLDENYYNFFIKITKFF